MTKLLGALAAIIFVFLDQFTKTAAKVNLEGSGPHIIIKDVFQLLYVENTGVAFGMLKGKLFLFTCVTIVVLGILFYFYLKMPAVKRYIPLMFSVVLIFSGAIGNFIDRIRYGYVVDFFYFNLIDFPVFNVADIYVTIGAILLAVLFLFYYKEEELEFISFRKKNSDDGR